MNAISFLTLPPTLPESPVGTDAKLALAVRRFLAADRRYDEDGPDPLTSDEADRHVEHWDIALDGVAIRPAFNLADCAAKALALVAAIRRELNDDETEDDLPPVLALAYALGENLVALDGSVAA